MDTAGSFGLLLDVPFAEKMRRRLSFMVGGMVEVLAVGILAVVGAYFPYRPLHHTSRYVLVLLPGSLVQEPVTPAVKLPPPRRLSAVRQIDLSKFSTPSHRPEPHLVQERLPALPKIEDPRVHVTLPAPFVEKPAEPVRFADVQPVAPRPAASVVRTGMFSQSPVDAADETTPLKRIQTGGFGDSLAGSRSPAANPGTVMAVGTFDLPAGPGRGNGTGGSQGVPRTVASAGFGGAGIGNGGLAGSGQGAAARVRTGAFGDVPPSGLAGARQSPAAASVPNALPVEILSKPSPQYTEEARQLRVQGEVVLSVVFRADGTIAVVSVVKALGHGLDQMAAQAASQIRFKPAQQGGRPTDFPAILRIEFRLA